MIEPIDFGVVNGITTNVPSFNECRSTINVTFIPNRPETWINLKKNIQDILDDPDGYVLCSVDDIIKAKDEILELKDRVKELENTKKEYDDLNTSYINRGSKIECLELDLKDEKDKVNKYEKLLKNACGMKDYWYGTYYEAVRQSWSQGVSIRIVEANLKDNIGTVQVNNERAEDLKKENQVLKDRNSELEKDFNAAVENAKFWHDREKEVEEKLEDLKKENQTLKAKAVINSVYGLTSAELECVKSENSELKKDLKAANKQLDKMDADIDELKNKNRDLEKELAESKTFSEVRYEWHPDCFTVIYTKCDGTKEVVGMDLADDTDEKCTMGAFVCRSLNIPQCKKCKNHRYFANTGGHYCHLPDSKYSIPGIFRIDSLTDEEAEGPACDKFEARKE